MTHVTELLAQDRAELTPDQRQHTDEHVATCAQCRALKASLDRTDRMLRGREPYVLVRGFDALGRPKSRRVPLGPVLAGAFVPTAAVAAALVLVALVLMPVLGQRAADPAPTPVPTVPSSQTPAASPDEVRRIEAVVMGLKPQLNFSPSVPTYIPSDLVGQPSVVPPGGARGAASTLLEVQWSRRADARNILLMLQGPAGCCLDGVRAGATPNVQVRPGVEGQFIRGIDPSHGGPILWWVEGGVYLSLSSPSLTLDELLRVAASMKTLR